MVDFDAHSSDVNINHLGMRRLISEPSVYVSEDMRTIVSRHVDDGIAIGDAEGPDDFLDGLGQHFLLKISPEMTTGSSQAHLGRIIKMLDNSWGFTIRVAP